MFLVLWIIHLCSQLISVTDARGTRRQKQLSLKQENVQEDELVEALEFFLSEKEDTDFKTRKLRRGRQSAPDGLAGFQQDEICEQTGFETRKREECDEVIETECLPIQVTKFRTEIVSKCRTKSDKSCNITMKGVPKQECKPIKEKR